MSTFTEENYLKALLYLEGESGEVGVNELSKHLKIKMPTVTSMIKKLNTGGWVEYESYKPIKLTEQGRKIALSVVRKHRLTEMFLVEKMNFSWEQVHEIAEQIEHVKSPAFFDKMDELLQYPKVDPHGSPIPDKEGRIYMQNLNKLSEAKAHNLFTVKAVDQATDELLLFLKNKKIVLETKLQVLHVEPFDESRTVQFEKEQALSLSKQVCERILGVLA